MKNKKVLFITQAAVIAAIYVVLTFIANAFGLANHAIQIRFSEALTILPFFTPVAIPGLFIGCILSNLLTGCMPLDIIFGSLATLLGAIGTHAIRRLSDNLDKRQNKQSKNPLPAQNNKQSMMCKFITPLPPIIANTLIVPYVLAYVYQFEGSIPYFMFTVGIGEVISCGILGLILQFTLQKHAATLFQYY